MRAVYCFIVQIHPSAFREQFGREMMSIFDEHHSPGGKAELIADGLCSLARQWLQDSVLWTVGGAISIAGVEAWWITRALQKAFTLRRSTQYAADEHKAMMLTVVVVFSLIALAVMATVWMGYFLRRRTTPGHPLRIVQVLTKSNLFRITVV